MSSKFSQLSDEDNRIQAIEISTRDDPIYLTNVYLPPRGSDQGHNLYRAALATLREMIFKYQSTYTIIIAGDFNASFIRHYKDTRDDLFKSFGQEMQLKLPHDYPTTHTYI
jgi:endonuclease/exonuclease/phosphatase (EEP) superfamily protein YafD